MEKAHAISIDEPTIAHQAILFILDVLIRNGQEMPLEDLYNTFGDQAFTPQMLRAVGGNEQGLKNFLLRYPSLFTLNGNVVTANSGNPVRTLGYKYRPSNSNRLEEDVPQWDAKTMKEIEQEAIAFFRKQMARKEEEWLPIVSVAGHASQASSDIRKFVGPQNEFVQFLLKYPNIFLVREEYCGLKGKADVPGVVFPPPSPPPRRRISGGTMVSRIGSFKNSRTYGGSSNHLRLTPLEVKAVHYLMRLLNRCGRMLLQNIPGLISRAPETISNTIGFTREELIQFFKYHSAIFQLHPDGCVSVKADAVRALIHKDKSLTENSVFTNTGIILRIFPKYGIVNMENNEQVFFDIQSCQFETFGDLACILHPGDRLWFNAVLGPKDGSTKWRSLKTWIKMKSYNVEDTSSKESGSSASDGPAKSPSNRTSISVDDDLNQYQLDGESSDDGMQASSHNPSENANCLSDETHSQLTLPILSSPISQGKLNFVTIDSPNGSSAFNNHKNKSASKVFAESSCNGCLNPEAIRNQIHSLVIDDGIAEKCEVNEKLVSSPAQTISSGDILATNIFIE